MAKATGYKCDRCDKFEVGEKTPKGWLLLMITNGSPEVRPSFDLCGNVCLAELAIERAKEIDGISVGKVRGGPTGRTVNNPNADRGAHVSMHINRDKPGKHCRWCIAEGLVSKPEGWVDTTGTTGVV